MNFIGQHIFDFIARFRNDVFLEDISTGTIASGGNLGLDSNNKIVKADTESGELSFDGSTANGLLTYKDADEISVEPTLTFDASGAGRELNLSWSVSPTIEIENTANDANDGTLSFVNKRGTSQGAGSDGDDVGSIFFRGGDSAGNQTNFAQILGEIGDATNGEEAGDFSIKVAEYDGTLTTGLFLDGDTDADGEIDVTIGAGAASVTTIAGTLTIGSTAFVNNTGVVQVATQGTIDHDSLANFVTAEHVDWAGASAGTIHATNYSNTMGSGFTVSATTDSNATTITQGDDLFFAAGTGITCETTADGTVTITNTVSDTNTQLSTEQVQDIVGGMVSGNDESGITVAYQDSDGTLDFTVGTLNQNTTGSAATLTTARNIAGVAFDGSSNISLNNNAITNGAGYITSFTNTVDMGDGFTVSATTDSNATTITEGDDLFFAAGTGITCETTADGTVTITNTVTDTNTQLSTEQVQDIVGGMLVGTETRIGVSYDDTNGRINFVVDDMTADTNTQNTTTLSFVDSSDDVILRNTTGGAGSGTDDIKIVAGSNITLTHTDADNFTIAATDTNTNQLTEFTLTGDSGSNQTIAHGNTLDIAGGNAISTVVSATDTVTVNHDDTSSQASVNNSGSTFIQDVTLDTYGHVTGLTSAAIPTLNQDTTGQAGTVATIAGLAPNTATTAAEQTNITLLGTLTRLQVDDISMNAKSIIIQGDTSDTFNITTGAHGGTTMTTVDAAGSNGHISLIADGDIKLRTTTGNILVENPDTSIVDGQTIGKIMFSDADGAYDSNAFISAIATEDHDDSTPAVGTKLEFRASMKQDAGGDTLMLTLDPDDGATFSVPLNSIQLGHASDTTIARSAAGKVTIEGDEIVTLTADQTFTGIKQINLRKFPVSSGTDGNAIGDVVYFGGTTSMTVGKIYHYKSDGTWEIANADAIATSDGLLGVALGAASDTNGVLLRGMVTLDHDPGAVGDVLYVQSDNAGTPGDATATAPSASGDCVRVVGYCVHASAGNVWFNPDNTFIQVA